MFCRQQVADLAEQADRFESSQAVLSIIGSGDPRHFEEFCKVTGYKGPLYADPSLDVYSFLGFSKGMTTVLGISPVFKAVSAFRKGHRQGSIQGSTFQLGGAVVIDTSGTLRYYFAGKKAGDHPAADDLIRALA